jgi:hypothetical protein
MLMATHFMPVMGLWVELGLVNLEIIPHAKAYPDWLWMT